MVEDFRVGGIIPLAHVGGELKHGEEGTPQVSCSLDMALAILEDKSITDRWQLKEVINCYDTDSTKVDFSVICTLDLSKTLVNECKRLVGHHTDLVNDHDMDILPQTSQFMQPFSTEFLVRC